MILFPGMGADSRVFWAQRREMAWIETPDWIAHVPGESLASYAERWGRELDLAARPAIVGGLSMGGMIALEMARQHGALGVVLLASCRRGCDVSVLLKLSERVCRCLPRIVLDKGRVLGDVFLGRGGPIPAADRALLCRMAIESDVEFLRWAGRAITGWGGCEEFERGRPEVPVVHLHGTGDWAIPLRKARRAGTTVIQGGAHVLNMSHPAEVNSVLRRLAEDT